MGDNTDEEFDEEDDDEEYEPDYDGHPPWYEPTQCPMCDMLFMPSHEEAYYCDSCEVKNKKQIQEMLDETIHD